MRTDLFRNADFTHLSPFNELKSQINDLKRKNDNLTALVVVMGIVTTVLIVGIALYKRFDHCCCDVDDFYDDDFDLFDDDLEDDFE